MMEAKELRELRDRYTAALGVTPSFAQHLVDAMLSARDEEMDRVRAERDALKAELAEARAAIERVRELHAVLDGIAKGLREVHGRAAERPLRHFLGVLLDALDASQRPEDTREEVTVMADNTEFIQQIVSRWSTALNAVRYAGANAIAIPVADMAVILDAALDTSSTTTACPACATSYTACREEGGRCCDACRHTPSAPETLGRTV